MNPNENNPLTPSGTSAGGVTPPASSTPSPVDFTDPSSLNTNTSSLSMSDSLASAQDSLTSAGQAAVAPSGTIGLDQLGADKPSAAMDLPNQPLTPAAPVPGSIGSVTSVPANPEPATDPLVAAAAATPSAPSAPMTSVTASNMPTLGAAPSMESASAGASAPAMGGDKPYYNPFAPRPGTPTMAGAPTSSTSVPPALQPQTEKFSDRLSAVQNKKQGGGVSILNIIAWVLAVLGIGCSIFFFIKWQDAEARAKKPQIVYVEKEPGGEEQGFSGSLSCVQQFEGGIEGVENMVDYNRNIFAKYENGVFQNIDLRTTYNFTDGDAAEGARWYLDEQTNSYNEMAANAGIEALTIENNVDGAVATQLITAGPDQLVGDFAGVFMVPMAEDGSVNTDQEALKTNLEAAGFTCSVNE